MTPDVLREALWGDGDRRTRTVIIILFFIACVGYLLSVRCLDIETEVIRDRFANAETIFSGVFPVTEYPPLILVFIAIPRVFGSTPWGYEAAYVAQMFVFMIIGLLLTSRLAERLECSRRKAMLAYAVMTLLMLEFVLDRFDMIVMVFTLASFLMLVEKRYAWAFSLLAMGTLLKVYPAILLPLYIVYLMNGGRAREAAEGFVVFILTGVAVMAVCLVLEPNALTNFLGYNGYRPLQIESFAASAVYLLSMLGLTEVWIQPSTAEGSFLSDNLRGPLPDEVASFLLPLLVIAVAAVWLAYAWICRREGGSCDLRLLSLACLGCMLVFLVVNKVFSSQYMIWIIGPVVCATLLCEESFGRRILALTTVSLVLTQINFAYNVGYLGGGVNIDDLGMAVLAIRNLVVLAMLILVVRAIVVPPETPEKAGTARVVMVK